MRNSLTDYLLAARIHKLALPRHIPFASSHRIRAVAIVALSFAALTAVLPHFALPVHANLTLFHFATANYPAAIAFDSTEERLIVACSAPTPAFPLPCGGGQAPSLQQIDSSGTVTTFAPSYESDPTPFDVTLGVSPGIGGFAAGTGLLDCLIALCPSPPTITKISADGSVVTPNWSACTGATKGNGEAVFAGFAFDTLGNFGSRLLAVSGDGKLFGVDSTGSCNLIAS